MDKVSLLYDVYGRKQLKVVCEGRARTLYRITEGKQILEKSFVIPDHYTEEEIRVYLDDMLHEESKPGDEIHLISKHPITSLKED